MKRLTNRQEGQSIVIIAFALVALVALLALVVDAGNAYVQRRHIENAMDSGAQAGSLAFAQGQSSLQIWNAIKNYVQANGIDPNQVTAWYVVQDASHNNVVDRTKEIRAYGSTYYPTTIGGLPVVGVQVEGNKTFSTFFAGVVGVKQMPVSGAAACFGFQGACSDAGLFPIAISSGNFPPGAGGTPSVTFEDVNPTYVYTIRQRTNDSAVFGYSGNFGWLTWNVGDTVGDSNVANNMNNAETGISGTRVLSDTIKGDTSVAAGSSIQAALASRVSGAKPSSVIVPVYDQFTGSSSAGTARYRIVGFVRLKITGYVFNSTDKYIQGKIQKWVDPQAEGGCAYFGVSTAKCRPLITVQRALVGTIKMQKLTPTSTSCPSGHASVDVVNLVDSSISMGQGWDGVSGHTPSKLTSAINAVTLFNQNMRPDLGDRAALVSFSDATSGSYYSWTCNETNGSSGSGTDYYFGTLKIGLTNNITGTNGVTSKVNALTANSWTPIAGGLKLAGETALGTGHNSNSIAVIIFASDGMTNIELSGRKSGYNGSGTPPSCNNTAQQNALDQANILKGDTNPHDYKPDTIIFTIAMGGDSSQAAYKALLKSIASPDTDVTKPSHYQEVSDAASMQNLYQSIAQRVNDICSESCQIIPTEDFAGGALVTVQYPNGTTRNVTTTSNGEFVLTGSDLVDGTYTILSAAVTVNGHNYNIFTNGLGGPALGSSPTVVVGTSSGTYKADLFLKTGDQVGCGH